MKEQYWEFDQKAFKEIADRLCNEKTGWKILKVVSLLLGITGVLSLAGPQLTVSGQDLEERVILLGAGIIMGVVFFLMGWLTWTLGKRKFGDPFTSMRELFLYANESGIQFGYHDTRDSRDPRSMQVWQIAYSNIARVDRKGGLVTVTGRVELVEYQDMTANRIRSSYTKGQLGDMGAFSFPDCIRKGESFWAELEKREIPVEMG